MNHSISRFRFTLAAVFFGAVALTMVLLMRVAHADPVVVAQATTDAGWDLIQQYGLPWGGTLLAYGLLQSLLARNGSAHWIAQGRTLSALTGLAMVGEAVLGWKLGGASPSGIAVALFAAINLVMHSTVSGPVAALPRDPQAGRASLLVMLLLAIGAGGLTLSAASCGAAQHGGAAVINCIGEDIGTTPALDVATVLAIANLLATTKTQCTPAGGALDWACVEAAAINHGKVIGGCAISELVQEYLTPAAGRAAPPAESGRAARAALERFRVEHAGGATFHTAAGNL